MTEQDESVAENGWLRSCVCKQAQMESAVFREWARRFPDTRPDVVRAQPHLDRKLWEWCYIAQALWERGLLRPGNRGLGFAVGTEPLPALFAGFGCNIVATDQAEAAAAKGGWVLTKQHAANLEALQKPDLCQPDDFARRVTFRTVDMNHIPTDLRGFDFVWSACSFEHLGNIEKGIQFLLTMLRCLKPGGVAVHTTEYNVTSNGATVTEGPYVLFRRRDLEKVARQLNVLGHRITIDFDPGDGPADLAVDLPPYGFNPHLKLDLSGFTATSIGLIVHKSKSRSADLRLRFLLLRRALVSALRLSRRALVSAPRRLCALSLKGLRAIRRRTKNILKRIVSAA